MAEEGEKGEKRSFKVEDRRRFSPGGESRESVAKVDASEERDQKEPREKPDEEREHNRPLSEINFSTFVISLSTQALMHLGEIPSPLSGKVESDIPVAKQMIDILAILREKTRGNLDPGEEQLMEDVLYDLRMRYVEAVKKK